jgi:hypothetical protein
MCLIFERFGGLRADPADEIAGLDVARWGVGNSSDDLEASGPAVAAVTGPGPTGIGEAAVPSTTS